MILSEYEAKRHDLDRKLEEIGEREAAHKMELSVKYQAECKKIQSQIGQLKKKQKELLQKYQNDKIFFTASIVRKSTRLRQRCTPYAWSI